MSAISLEHMQTFGRLVPLVTIHSLDSVEPLAEALIAAKMQSVEVTLRSQVALQAIEIFSQFDQLKVIAGTITQPVQMTEALSAGAQLLVSPGATDALLDAKAPLVPGVATPSEVMVALAHGYNVLKAFPAGVIGGESWLKALAGPLPQAKFMVTGGVSLDNLTSIAACSNVVAIGGSWLASDTLIQQQNWQKITDNCLAAQELVCS